MSKKEEWHRQCRFEAVDGTGWDVFWIPEASAKVGKVIYKEDDEEKKHYRVVAVGDNRRLLSALRESQKVQRNYFKTTDI